MKSKVVYYTKSGNTKKIADAFGTALSCEVTDTSKTLNEFVDVLFLGASVYKLGIDKSVIEYINNLDSKIVGSVVVFSTSAFADSGYSTLVKAFADKAIKVQDKHFYCKGSFLMMNKNRPNENDINTAKVFANEIMQNCEENK